MSPFVAEGQMIVDVAKGIEEATLMTLSEQIHQEIPQADVAVLSGPSHAGRGRTETADNVCDRSENEKDSGVSAVDVQQPCLSCLYKS